MRSHENGKVWVGFENYFDNCEIWTTLAKIFKTPEAAEKWKNEVKETRSEWRSIEDHAVEE